MAREKGTGSLQREKSGRYTLRVGINGKRYSRSTGTRDRDAAERFAQRFLSPYGLGPKRLPLAEVWFEYERSPNRRDLAPATLASKRQVWMHFARWMEHGHIEVSELGQLTSDMVGEYLRCLKVDHCGTTYNNHVCVLREICRTLYDKAGIYDDPWSGVRLLTDDSHSRREFTIDELQRILEAARKYDLERRSLRDTQSLARSNVPTTTAGAAYGTIASCQGCVDSGATTSTDSSCAVAREAGVVGTPNRSKSACGEATCVQKTAPSTKHQAQGTTEWHTLFLIGIYTGLRLGDCCTLEWANVNLERKVIQVIPQKTRKHAHGHPVTIPIHPVLEAALRTASSRDQESGIRDQKDGRACRTPARASLRDSASPRGIPATAASLGNTTATGSSRADGGIPPGVGTPSRSQFACAEGTCVQNSPAPSTMHQPPSTHVLPTLADWYRKLKWRVSEGLKRIFAAANITTSVRIEGRRYKAPEATFHSLRHTFVSLAANAGVPLTIIQSIVGHESTAMTRHYYHESEAGLWQAIAALPALGVGDGNGGRVGCPQPTVSHLSHPSQMSHAPAPPTADRLRELDALLAAKAITRREYKATRARILAEI